MRIAPRDRWARFLLGELLTIASLGAAACVGPVSARPPSAIVIDTEAILQRVRAELRSPQGHSQAYQADLRIRALRALYDYVAWHGYEQGADEEAGRYYKDGLQYASSDGRRAGDLEFLMGAYYSRQLSNGLALPHFRSALEYWERVSYRAGVAVAYHGLAAAYLDMGDHALGTYFLSNALDVAQQYYVLGERRASLDEWNSYTQLLLHAMEVASWSADRHAVEELDDRLEAVLARYAPPAVRVGRWLSAAGALAAVGDGDRARRLMAQAQQSLWKDFGSDPRVLGLLALDFTCTDGVVTFHRGEYRRAISKLEQCVALRRAEGVDTTNSDALVVQKMLGRAYEELGDVQSAIRAYGAAVKIYERIRGSFSVPDRTMFFQRLVRSSYQGLIRTLSMTAEQSGSSVAFLAALQASERLRARQLGEMLGASGTLPTSLERLRDSVGPDSVLLSYTLTAEEIIVLAVTAEEHAVAVRRCESGDCERTLLRAAASLANFRSREVDVQERLAGLTHVLLEPVERLVREKRRILVVPDGLINLVPFDMLYDDPVKRTALLLDRVVRVLPSVALMEGDSRPARSREARRILAVGDPDYGRPRAPGGAREEDAIEAITRGAHHVYFNPLPETRREVETIQGLFGEDVVTVLLGSHARESSIKKMDLERFNYLHFATHGILGQDVPGVGEPALVLAEEAGEDGFLTASEVGHLRLDAELTVLSACNTGLGPIVTGEGVIGLARAFLAAGSRVVVVSLWEVESRATERLMGSFYSSLKAGHDPAEALRLAKLEMMGWTSWGASSRQGQDRTRSAAAQYGHPYFWAGFIVVQRR